MTQLPRLTRASRALSAKQRVLLHVQAHREGRTPDPAWMQFTDERERRLYDRYMGVVYVANADLGLCFGLLQSQVVCLASRKHVFEVTREAAEKTALEEGVVIDWRKARRAHEGKGDLDLVTFLANLSEQARDPVADEVAVRWQELRALETVWAVMTEDFDGTDPVVPEMRLQCDELKASLRELARRFGVTRLPEPQQPFIDRLWELVDLVYDTMKLVKEEP